jgi:hypothetical protein
MLMSIDVGTVTAVVAIVVGVLILIRLLLLAGRLVRAVEKIAEKKD